MGKNEKNWAFFYQRISKWNHSFREPGFTIATKQQMKEQILYNYSMGIIVKIEKSEQVSETITQTFEELKKRMEETIELMTKKQPSKQEA